MLGGVRACHEHQDYHARLLSMFINGVCLSLIAVVF